jgi:hypothetical protein
VYQNHKGSGRTSSAAKKLEGTSLKTETAALIIQDFSVPTCCGTMQIPAAFSVLNKGTKWLRLGPNKQCPPGCRTLTSTSTEYYINHHSVTIISVVNLRLLISRRIMSKHVCLSSQFTQLTIYKRKRLDDSTSNKAHRNLSSEKGSSDPLTKRTRMTAK